MKYKVIHSNEVILDLQNIQKYIRENSNTYSIEIIKKILHSTRNLSSFPKTGRIIPELQKENYREYFIYSYRILYKIENNTVILLAIIHMSQDKDITDIVKKK